VTARIPRPRGDGGQALPVYITAIGALLFLAFAYFAVGQAAATRDGAQTAADAAALAAAQDRSDQLRGQLLNVLGPGGALGTVGQLLGGHFPALHDSCGKAAEFARDNRAHTTDCHRVYDPDGYSVTVETDESVGRSVVPGTENRHAHASATAVVTPLCRWQSGGGPANGAPPSPTPTATGPSPGGGRSPAPSPTSPGTLRCQSGSWTVDPAHLDLLPPAADLFSVHLTS
jgi:hypothetical protein